MQRDDKDGASMFVLEGLLIAFLALGAVLYLSLLPLPGQTSALRQADTSLLAQDVLQILSQAETEPPYRSLLHRYVTEAVLGNPAPLEAHVERLLPEGAGWGLYLDNGETVETLVERNPPVGEREAANLLFYPEWSYALVFATLDRQPGIGLLDTMHVKVVPVKNSYLDREATGNVTFANGHEEPLERASDGLLVAPAVPPADVGRTAGFPVPYDLTDPLAKTASVAAHATAPPTAYAARANLSYRTLDRTVYHVHPTYVADQTLQAFLGAGPRISSSQPKFRPGENATLSYDYTGLPLAAGWGVSSRELVVYGPVLGNTLVSEQIPTLEGDYVFRLPRSAFYGTYVVEVRLTLVNGDLVQVVHDVTTFDVLRRGVDGPAPPLYRAVLSVWFNGV